MAASDVYSGRFLTVACYLRGRNISSREVDEAMSGIQRKVRRPFPFARTMLVVSELIRFYSRPLSSVTPPPIPHHRTARSSLNGFQTRHKQLSVPSQHSILPSLGLSSAITLASKTSSEGHTLSSLPCSGGKRSYIGTLAREWMNWNSQRRNLT